MIWHAHVPLGESVDRGAFVRQLGTLQRAVPMWPRKRPWRKAG